MGWDGVGGCFRQVVARGVFFPTPEKQHQGPPSSRPCETESKGW